MTRVTPEKEVEKYLRLRLKAIGGKAVKMVPTFENGIPDRMVLYQGKAIFVELKKVGKKPEPLQIAYMKELEKHGFATRVIDSKEQVDQLIREITDETGDRFIQASTGRRWPNLK